MGTTPIYGIPYIEPTDALANYPTQDKAQAEAVEAALATYATPRAARYKSATQSLTANVWAPVAFEGDEPGQSSAGITYAGGIFTVAREGVYLVNTALLFAGTAAPQQRLRIGNATVSYAEVTSAVMGASAFGLSKAVRVPAGGQIYVSAFATAAGQTVYGSTVRYSTVDITLVAP